MTSKGILDTQYALDREKKPELIFRYKTRAQFVANCATTHLGGHIGLNVLDFGAAEGLTIRELDSLMPGGHITGIEYSQDLVDRAVDLPPNVILRQGDVTALPAEVKEKQYDVVSALALLEHLPNPLEAVKEAASVLAPGGLFVASAPNPFWDDVSTTLGLLRDEQHEMEMTQDVMTALVEDAGLSSIGFERFMWSPVAFLPYLKIPVNPRLSLVVDGAVRKLRVFDWLYVNQAIIAQKR